MNSAPFYPGFMQPFYNPYYGQMMVGTNTQGFFVRKSKSKPFNPSQPKGEAQPNNEENNINMNSDFVNVQETKKPEAKKEKPPKMPSTIIFMKEKRLEIL